MYCLSFTRPRKSKTTLGSGFQVLDADFFLVEIGFRIAIVSGIADSLSCIPDSKPGLLGFWISEENFPGFQNPHEPIHWKFSSEPLILSPIIF